MDLFEFYKELYHKENDRRQEVINALNIPLAIVTALATAVFILVTTFSYKVHWVSTSLFIIGMLAATYFLICSIFYLSHAFINMKGNFEYTGIPYAKSLFDWHKQLDVYNQQNFASHPNVDQMADEQFKEYLIKNFVDHIDHNTYVNDQKHSYIFNSKHFLIYCLISCLISLLPFGWGFFNREDEIHKVEIIKSKEETHKQSLEYHAKPTTSHASPTSPGSSTSAAPATAPAEQADKRRDTTAPRPQAEKEGRKIKSMNNGAKPARTHS